MSDRSRIVTIDGPSGVGKSTVSRMVARRIGFTYLDTGAMYRAVALRCKMEGIDTGREKEIQRILSDLHIQLLPAPADTEDVLVLLNGEDVSRAIRTEEISMLASAVSTLGPVRERLTGMQREIGAAGGLVAEGRDMGTVVFPGAAWKFYLDASPEERARRRIRQMRRKGLRVNEQEILERIIKRDRNDRERSLAPLRAAPDAVHIDSTDRSVEEVVAEVLAVVRTK